MQSTITWLSLQDFHQLPKFKVVPLDCNILSPLRLQWSNTLKKKKHLGCQSTLIQLPWLHCYLEIVAHAEIFYGFWREMMMDPCFPKKSLKLKKKLNFSVWPLPNGAPNPTDQSHPISIYRAPPCKYLHSLFFILDLLLKLRAIHIRKNLTFRFSQKMAPTILIKFCGVHSKSTT